MEKAAKVVKRGSARLRSLGSGHGDLSVCISEQRDVKNTAKAFINAQQSATEYQLKWAAGRDNKAVLDVANQVWELNCHWAEVQQHFVDKLREYQKMFELMLEGERSVDLDRASLTALTEKQAKYEKELKRAMKRGHSADELEEMRNKLAKVESQKELAETQLAEKFTETEAVKLIRFRSGLSKLSDAYMNLGGRCQTIFQAQKELAGLLPDMNREERLEDVKYRGAIHAREIVRAAVEETQVETPSGVRRSSHGAQKRGARQRSSVGKKEEVRSSPRGGGGGDGEEMTEVKKRTSAPPDLDDLPPPYSASQRDCHGNNEQPLSERRRTFPLNPLSNEENQPPPPPLNPDLHTGYQSRHNYHNSGLQTSVWPTGSSENHVLPPAGVSTVSMTQQKSHLYPDLKQLFPEEDKKAIPTTDVVEVPVNCNTNVTRRTRAVTKFI